MPAHPALTRAVDRALADGSPPVVEINPVEAAVAAALAADAAWSAAYNEIRPPRTWPGDFRYTDAAKGEPGSPLRALYDDFRAKSDALSAAFRAAR